LTTVLASYGQSNAWSKATAVRCEALDVARLDDAGRLNNTDKKAWMDYYKFSVDLDKGVLFYNKGQAQVMEIFQRGSATMDTVLVRQRSERWTAVDDFLRIRDWKQNNNITFFLIALSMVVTGTCERLQ
jgi:hypothetical protein